MKRLAVEGYTVTITLTELYVELRVSVGREILDGIVLGGTILNVD